MKLAMTDIDRYHRRCAPLQDTVGEATGGRPGIENVAAGDIEGERFKSGIEFLAAATDEPCCRARDFQRFAGINHTSGLQRWPSPDRHPAEVDQFLRIGTRGRQAASNELKIETSTHRGD
jgi:hypothetical protein